MQKHNYFIDMLRFFAASIVVFFHLNQAIPPVDNWYRNLINYGWLGVPIFFVISGYCIIISAYNSSNMQEFLNRRFFRVFPPYWASIIVVLFAACFQKVFTGFNSVHDIPRNISSIVTTLTLTTSPLTNIKTVNWVYWTLTCELLFYLTMYLLLLFNKKHILFLLIFISLIAWKLPHSNTGILFFLDNWSPFGLGISIYYCFKSTNKISLIGFGVLLIINILGLFSKFGDHTDYVIVTLIATGLIFFSNYVKFPNNLFAVMGKHSYSVYLIHVPIGIFIIGLFENPYIQQNPIANFIYDLTVYLFVNIMAWFMYNWIEKPSIAYGRKFSERYFNNNLQKHIA